MTHRKREFVFLQGLLILAAGFWAFSPALSGGWLWDDSVYLTQNPIKQAPDGWWKIWSEPGNFIEYYPIEATVQWWQWQSWHQMTFGYHLTNILLHLCNAFLVWKLFNKLGLRLAWLGALIFTLHPTTVESVAWISELKNTLSLPFFLLAMCAWIDFEERRSSRDYFLSLGLLVIGMLCKISMIMFPWVILLYAWWKRGRVNRNDFRAAAPFFAISLLFGLLALAVGSRYIELHGLGEDVQLGGFLSRLACAGLTLSFYFWESLWPIGLLTIYPQWKVDPPTLAQFLPWLVFAGLFYWCWRNRMTWGRHAFLGIGFFVLNLLPFLGFVVISYMSFTWTSDHLLYLPLIGLIGLAMAGLDRLNEKTPRPLRPVVAGFVAVVLIFMALETHGYTKKFQDESTLWAYVLQRNPQAWPAYDSLGNAELQEGRAPRAAELYQKALQLRPNSALSHNNLGVAWEQMGQTAQATQEYREALRLAPGYLDAQQNLTRLEGR